MAPRPKKIDTGFRNLWRFVGFAMPYWRYLAMGQLTGVLRMALPLYVPVFVAMVVDHVADPFIDGTLPREDAAHRLWLMLGIFIGAAVIHSGATLGRFYFPHMAMAAAMRDLRYKLFAHLQRLSLAFHTDRPTGGIVARVVSDVNQAQTIIDALAVQASQQMLRAVVIVAVFLWIDWQWALVSFAAMPLFFLTTHLLKPRMRSASRKVQDSVERVSGRVQERMSMIREVQSFTAEDYEEAGVLEDVERLRVHHIKQRLLNGLLNVSTELTRFGALAMVVGFGVYRIFETAGTDDAVTPGMLVLFYQYTNMATQPMNFLANLYAQMHSAAASADRVFDFFDTVPDVRDQPDAEPLEAPRPPAVRFEHVSFYYPAPDNPMMALHDVSFETKPGDRVVLVGPSGAGKSTMMALIPRLYDAQEGAIYIGSQRIREVTLQTLRANVGIVPQEPVLFSGSIKENIRYGKFNATDDEIVEAAKMANAHDFILEQPDGYETLVGERGVGLSGGQIQRLAIARAFLKDPAVLIMDEATSNLDAVSENLVMDAIDRLAVGRTTFLIAHRLSTARNAQQILVLDAGRIAERGSHDQLMALNGVYADLWRRQMEGRV